MPQGPSVKAPKNSLTYFDVFHDCDHTAGLAVSGGGTFTYDGIAGHPGVFGMTTSTSQWNQVKLNWGSTASVKPFNIDNFERVTWVFKIDSVVDVATWFGLYGGTGVSNDQNQTGSIVSYISNTALSFHVNSAGTSNVTTSVTVAANTWYKFDIVRNSATSVSLWVNDVLAATITTGVPSGSICGIGGRLMTATTSAKSWYVDSIHPRFVTPTSRY